MKLRDIKQILTSFLGKLVNDLGEEEEREVSYVWFELLHMKLPDDCDLSKDDTLKTWK